MIPDNVVALIDALTPLARTLERVEDDGRGRTDAIARAEAELAAARTALIDAIEDAIATACNDVRNDT